MLSLHHRKHHLVYLPPSLTTAEAGMASRFTVVLGQGGDVTSVRDPEAFATAITSTDLSSSENDRTETVAIIAVREGHALNQEQERLLSIGPALILCLGPSKVELDSIEVCNNVYRLGGFSLLRKWKSDAFDRLAGTIPNLWHPNSIGLLRECQDVNGDIYWELRQLKIDSVWSVRFVDPQAAVDYGTRTSFLPMATAAVPRFRCILNNHAFSEQDLLRLANALADNHRPTRAARLFVDVTEFVRKDAKTGIQRVVRNVLCGLLDAETPYRVEPVYRDHDHYRYARQLGPRLSCDNLGLPEAIVDFAPGDVFLGLDLDPSITPEAARILAERRRRGLGVLFVIYDLLPLTHPDWFPVGASSLFQRWLSLIASCADRFLCISEATAHEMGTKVELNYNLTHQPDVVSLHLGADIGGGDLPRPVGEESYGLETVFASQSVFLAVGTVEPRKGYRQLLDAFDHLWSEGHDYVLVIVGKRGWMMEDLFTRLETHTKRNERLFWFDTASDATLEEIYRRSMAIIVPSEGEGFGLPIVEAAKYSLPIIARDLPVFHEVAGEGAYYFRGETGNELARAILKWHQLHREGRAPDPAVITIRTWSDTVQEILSSIHFRASNK